jgi:hypothetical protein
MTRMSWEHSAASRSLTGIRFKALCERVSQGPVRHRVLPFYLPRYQTERNSSN